jgi:hypothetical protein
MCGVEGRVLKVVKAIAELEDVSVSKLVERIIVEALHGRRTFQDDYEEGRGVMRDLSK